MNKFARRGIRTLCLLAALAQPVAGRAYETSDFAEAGRLSRETGRPILLKFTRSDTCPICAIMDVTVFDSVEFQRFARVHLIVMEVDFPRKTKLPLDQQKQNAGLAFKYDIVGYPTSVLVDHRGKRLRSIRGGIFKPDEFLARLDLHHFTSVRH